MPEMFDPEERAAAELDEAIDLALAAAAGERSGKGVDPVLHHLAVLHQAPLPPELGARVCAHLDELTAGPAAAGAPDRPAAWWPLRLAAGMLGLLLLAQSYTLWFNGAWLASLIGHGYEPHIYKEQAIALFAVAIGLLWATLRPTHLPGLVPVAASLGVMYGLFGATELPHAINPAAEYFHFLQAALAAALILLWWKRPRSLSSKE